MTGKITISNAAADTAIIDIEGIIGVPEEQQFDDPNASVATYQSFREVIEKIKTIGQNEIIVNIRSTGGNVNDALLIHDSLASLNAKVTTRCFGYVASAATIIAQAASAGCREISANSLYLIHKSVCSAEGNAQTIAQTMDMLDKTDKRITGIYADRSGKQASEFAALMGENNGNGRWLSPDETIGQGLADRIIAATPIKPETKNAVRNLGLPPIPKRRKNMVREISEMWNRALASAGIAGDKSKRADVNGKRLDDEDTIVAGALANAITTLNQEETDRFGVAEARSRAMPTATKQKEDPSIQEVRVSANESAYMEDLKKFTGQ